MSHVDEGALHAYLDGALDEYPPSEAQRVREHLDVCAICREQLDAERGIRDAAASILGLAAPEVDVPSLEELRAYVRANAPAPSPISVRIYRLGWAASVVLALGTGWMLRGGQVPVTSPTGLGLREDASQGAPSSFGAADSDAAPAERAVEESSVAGGRLAQEAQPEPTAEVARRGVLGPVPSTVEAIQSPEAAPADPSSVAGGVGALSVDVLTDDVPAAADIVADLDVSAALRANEARLDEVVATDAVRRRAEAEAAGIPPTSTAEVVAEPRAEREEVADAAGAAAAAEPERRSGSLDVVTSANAAAPVAGLGAQRRSIEFGDNRDEVDTEQESYSLVVPGLDAIDIRFRGTGVRSEGQIVLQRLESGDTLEVIHLPPEMDPSSLEDPTPGDTELIVQRAAGWIIMRAPVSEEALLELLERLLAGD